MSTRPASTATARKRAAVRPPSEAGAEAREARGARRKRETRDKLLDAAFRLMAERGMDAVAINEITEAADVGFGSFYNHFESKEAIYGAVMQAVFEEFADALDALVRNHDDPAEMIAICVRHTVLRARREPLWGRLLAREGFSTRVLSHGLGLRLLRDIQNGIGRGRFKVPDPLMSFVAAGSTVLGAVVAQADVEAGADPLLKQLGVDIDSLPGRAAAVLLHGLGLPFEEAQAIASRPLPEVEAPAAG